VPQKTAKGKRSIGLSQITVDALRRHRLVQDKQKRSWAMDYGLVLPNDVGEPKRSRNVINGCFERVKKKGNLPDVRFHDLRHTCATLLLSKNVHPKIVQELLGHANIGITLGYLFSLPAQPSGRGCEGYGFYLRGLLDVIYFPLRILVGAG
jgi:integrase